MKRGWLAVRRAGLAAMALGLPGCIVVSREDSDYARIESKKADAQYLAARVELERLNLERHKAGLPPVEVPSTPAVSKDVDEPTAPSAYP